MGAIGLNPIRLDRIGLDPIRINAIKLGVPGAASDSDRPYIDPEVLASLRAVCICYGKSNDDPDRAVVKNLVDPDNPFVVSNAAFKLNSGFGKYEVDFLDWTINSLYITERTSFAFSAINTTNRDIIVLYQRVLGAVQSFKIKVNLSGRVLYRYYVTNGDTISVAYYELKDGINILPDSVDPTSVNGRVGFVLKETSYIKLEQIPSFEGAFVTDGVDDLITSTKTVQEMEITEACTVISMIHQINTNENNYITTNSIRTPYKVVGRNIVKNISKTGIYGWYKEDVQSGTIGLINNVLGDKNDYIVHNSPITNTNPITDSKFYVTGYNEGNNVNEISQAAWYWTIIANKVLTTDQINQVIAYFNLDRTLKPDILCNTIKQGITNENHAEFGDKLIDFSDNGRDIQLNNIAWKGDSGIGKYNFSNINIISSNRFEGAVTTNKCHFTKKLTNTTNNFCDLVVISPNEPIKFKVSGLSDGRKLFVANKSGSGSNYNFDNGEHEVSLSFSEGVGQNNPFGVTGDIGDIDVTVEFIPSHAGALCLDGVSDYGQYVGDLGLKDYTLVADRAYDKIALEQAPFIASKETNGQAPFLMEYLNSDTYIYPHSFGTTTKTINLNIQRQISYQSTYVYNGNTISKGTSIDTGDGLTIGNSGSTGGQYSPLCLWSLILFPYSMSEFLIERQLKKHKLGTLYPDMVEFRPVIKANDNYKIFYTAILPLTGDVWEKINIGDYVPVGRRIAIQMSFDNEAKKLVSAVSSQLGNITIVKNSNNIGYTIFGDVLKDKSPQKINITIEQDENYVQWNPIVESNVEYSIEYFLPNSSVPITGNYYSIGTEMRFRIKPINSADEIKEVTVYGHTLEYSGIDNAGRYIYVFELTSESPQNINITIDEYIRYEDIVQPYPVLLRFNDESGKEVSWGGKFRVGSTITRIGRIADPESNLLNGLYSISGLSLNGKAVTSSTSIVEKQMVFKTTATYLLDNNEPKCILSPSRLRIPNSSYKILGHIPDISGHGNHGVIHNSAYAEGSGVNEDGSYQFDGVDDFVTIPTLSSGGKQVLMKVNWQDAFGNLLYDQRSADLGSSFAILAVGSNDTVNNKIAYQARNAIGTTYVDGVKNKYIESYTLNNITHNIAITNSSANSKTPVLGASNKSTPDYFSKLALYDFMLFDKISTDDKIKELNEYVGIEAKVELPPYYWDAYGKTNFDEDRSTIQQRGIAEGDYDLTNYNHAYDKMSGYEGYNFSSFNNVSNWALRAGGAGVEVISRDGYSITLKKLAESLDWDISNNEYRYPTIFNEELPFKCRANKNVVLIWQLKYRTEGATSDTTVTLLNQQLTPNVPLEVNLPYKTQDELTELGAVSTSVYYLLYFSNTTLEIGEEYTVEMLPLYSNGLVYDGVTDYSENPNVEVLTDFTFLIKCLVPNGFTGSGGAVARKGIRGTVTSGAYGFIYALDSSSTEANRNSYWSFGKALIPSTGAIDPPLIGYMTPTSVNGVATTRGTNPDMKGFNLADWSNAYINMIYFKSILYNKTISMLQINFLKNLMERDEIIDLNNPIFIQE